MTEVNQYKIYCISDSKFEYVWGTTTPTTCPVNTVHTIDTNSIAIVKTVGDPIVTIKEEETPTGGHFRADTVHVTAQSYEIKNHDMSWPIPVSVLSIIVHPSDIVGGDNISVIVAPNTTVGVITATGATGAITLNVSSTVTQYMKIGFHASLAGHTGAVCDLGRVINVSKETNQITVEKPVSVHDFAPNITAVKQNIYMMYKHELPPSSVPFTVGDSKIGASYIPANTTIRAVYENTSTGTKEFLATVEYLY